MGSAFLQFRDFSSSGTSLLAENKHQSGVGCGAGSSAHTQPKRNGSRGSDVLGESTMMLGAELEQTLSDPVPTR